MGELPAPTLTTTTASARTNAAPAMDFLLGQLHREYVERLGLEQLQHVLVSFISNYMHLPNCH